MDDLKQLSIFDLELKIYNKTIINKYEEFLETCNDNYNFMKDKLKYLNEFYISDRK